MGEVKGSRSPAEAAHDSVELRGLFEVAEVPGAGHDLKLCGGYRARSTLLEASDEVFAPLGQERAVFHRLLDKILETLRGRG